MQYSNQNNGALYVSSVSANSPPYKAGIRSGDYFQGDYSEVEKRLSVLKAGEAQSFAIERRDATAGQRVQQIKVEIVGDPPDLNGVWYADMWYPIAGAMFLFFGLLIFATASIMPLPLWRPLLISATGLGMAIGFFVALHGASMFSMYVIWRSGWAPFISRSGSHWVFYQGFMGITAGVFLAVLAAAELRVRLASAQR